MPRISLRSMGLVFAPLILWLSGCGALYLIFGEGGLWPPGTSGVSRATSTQPATVIGPRFSAIPLDPLLESTAGARVVVAADMNGDGLMDFVSGSAESQPIQLHLRSGAALEYATISIAGGAPISTMYDLHVADFDADGRLDIAVLVNDTGFVPVTNAEKRGAVVFLFAPADPSDALSWEQVVLNETFFLPNDSTGVTDFFAAEMDNVNGPDIVLASNEIVSGINTATKRIYLFQNPGGSLARSGANWLSTASPVQSDVPPIKAVAAADIDGDGDLDIAATFPTAKSHNVRWLINPLVESGLATVSAGNWAERIIGEQRELLQPGDQQVPGADFLSMGDIDGDGDLDAAVAHQSLGVIQWFENPGQNVVQIQNFPWRVYNIGMTIGGVSLNQMQLVDLDLNGTLDLFVAGGGNLAGFQRQINVQDFWQPFTMMGTDPIATIGRCAFLDVNADGRLDIVAPLDRSGITKDQFLILLRQ